MNRHQQTPIGQSQIPNSLSPDSPEEILRLDDERRRIRNLPFDPISGRNSIGPRFELHISGFDPAIIFLPESMRAEPLVAALESSGSAARAAARLGISADELLSRFHRLRMLHDFPYWAASAVKIKRKGGGEDVSFILNAPQRRLVELFESMRLQNLPIRVILLKARQWGGSTATQLYIAWLQLVLRQGLNSLIIAHQGAGTDEIKDMFDRMISSYPRDLLIDPDDEESQLPAKGKVMERAGRSGAAFRIPLRNCKIKIGSAERPDSCRGGDYNLVHLSEVGVWKKTLGKNPEDIVRSACGGVLDAPYTMIVYESTANGTGNFFHSEYLAATAGQSPFRPLFVAWYEIAQYSKPLSDEQRRAWAERLIEGRNDDTSTSRSESGRYLFDLFRRGASLEALEWYVGERSKFNDHARMAAEFPSDDIEAFAHSGARVFDRYAVEALRRNCCDPLARGDVVSSYPDSPKCLSDVRFHPSAAGGMEIWEFPGIKKHSDRFLTVVDVGGRSDNADWSVILVIDRLPMLSGGYPAIAAQWRGHCDIDILAWRAGRIAAFYHDSLLVIESNTIETREASRMLDGDQTPYILSQLRDAYPNLYERPAPPEAIAAGVATRLGFHTNVATKSMVIATLIRAVRDGLYTERSAACLDELLCYERRQNGSFGAIEGKHDDLVMTRAIGLHIALEEMDPPRFIASHTPLSRRPPRPDLAF